MNSNGIKELRNRLHLSQKKLAEVLGVESNTVARWERGESRISPAMVERLEKIAREFPSGDAIMRTSNVEIDSHHRAILVGLETRLDPEVFEACAVDLLRHIWPSLIHVRGGGDDGFDGAVADGNSREPFPLIVTTDKIPVGNLIKNLNQAQRRGWDFKRVLFATSRRITPSTRRRLVTATRERNMDLTQTYDQDWFASRLYHEPEWCRKLLGVTGRPHALSIFPITQRPVLGTQVLGREEEMQWLLDERRGDCLVVGEPGSGKTFLLRSLALQGKALFLVDMNREQIANDIRSLKPSSVIVDDAHVHQEWIKGLVQIRSELRAEFRIIVASWLAEADTVRTVLGIGHRESCKLKPISADLMIEIIRSAGISGPDELLRIIRKQANGKPGLAVTLVHMCLVGDIREVVRGEGLVNQIASSLEEILGNGSLILLGAFALGGNAGMKPNKVADHLGMPIHNVADDLAKLAASGIIAEKPVGPSSNSYCPLSIEPPDMRGALVRRIFYRGAGSLAIENFLPIVQNTQDTLETLIDARSCGASIPDLEDWLEEANMANLWLKFASQGPREVNYVLDKHPELIMEISSVALSHTPEKAIPMLLTKAGKDSSYSQFPKLSLTWSRNSVLDKLESWIQYSPSQRDWTLVEREKLLQCAATHWKCSKNAHVAISAMCIALNPVFQFGKSDPGMGNEFTHTRGVIPATVIDQLAEKWPLLATIVDESDDVPWTELFNFLQCLSDPVLVANNKSKEAADQLLQRVVNDLIKTSHQHPGIQRRLKELAELAGIIVEINSDPVFDCFYPSQQIVAQSLDQEQDQSESDLIALVDSWSILSVEEIAHRLNRIETEANLANISYPCRSRKFCELLSEKLPNIIATAKSFIKHRVPANLLEPLLQNVTTNSQSSWSIVEDCLNDEFYVDIGVAVAITSSDAPSEIISIAVDKAKDMTQLIEHICRRGEASEAVLLTMLRSESSDLAIAAALGYWSCNRKNHVNGPLGEAWKHAVLRSADADTTNSQHDDFWIGEILVKDSELATKWLIRLVCNKKPYYGFHTENTAKEVAATLNEQQRRAVLKAISCDNSSLSIQKIVGALVGNSTGLYRELLDSPELGYPRLAPLAGRPSEGWQAKAVLALDYGYSNDEIIEATQMNGWSWTGSMANMWSEWVCDFEKLLKDVDPRIVKLAKRGMEIMSKQEKTERERERKEAIRGYS